MTCGKEYERKLEGLYAKASTAYIKEHFESLPKHSAMRSMLRTEYTKRINQPEQVANSHVMKPKSK